MRRPCGKQRTGAVIVEAAFVLPIVLLFLLGVVDYGRFLLTLHVVDNAAREGAAYAAKHTSAVVLGGTTYGNATSDVTSAIQFPPGRPATQRPGNLGLPVGQSGE